MEIVKDIWKWHKTYLQGWLAEAERTRMGVDDKGRTDVTERQRFLRDKSATSQYVQDCLMWWGYLHEPKYGHSPNRHKQECVMRAFLLLHYGGLMVRNRNSVWVPWNTLRIPLAAALSHGGAVLVQLPPASMDDFIDWLKGPHKGLWHKRMGSHGILRTPDSPQTMPNGRSKVITEVRTSPSFNPATWFYEGKHRAVEIGLGGVGHKNPYSGKEIEENGEHGLLYIFYDKEAGGVLLKCENSACWGIHHPTGGQTGQSGHAHGTNNVEGEFSATGGRKWGNWAPDGPGFGVDNMFLAPPDDFLTKARNGTYRYDPSQITSNGADVDVARAAPVLAELYTPLQWEEAAHKVFKKIKEADKTFGASLVAHVDTRVKGLLTRYHAGGANKAQVKAEIREFCRVSLAGRNASPGNSLLKPLLEELQNRCRL